MDFDVTELVYLIVACLGSVCTCILSFLNLKRSGTTKKEVLSLCEKTDSITKQIPTEDKNSARYLDEFSKAAQTLNDSGVSWKELLETSNNQFYGGLKKYAILLTGTIQSCLSISYWFSLYISMVHNIPSTTGRMIHGV